MSAVATPPLMTAEQFLALPDDGVDRDLIRGQLKEKSMSRRGRPHSRITGKLTRLFGKWYEALPEPRGELLVGEQAFCLKHDPDTTVGIDIAYISAELAAKLPEDVFLIDGLPDLAVEILSPSDTVEDVADKVNSYLEAGISLVWVVDPYFQFVTVHRPSEEPQLLNRSQELVGDPLLPGLRIKVADIFTP